MNNILINFENITKQILKAIALLIEAWIIVFTMSNLNERKITHAHNR